MKVGDSVMVKPGVRDPDLGEDIGGWHGRIVDIYPDNLMMIEWDSMTLKQMSMASLAQCAEQGLDWTRMTLEVQEVELTTPRDTPRDVVAAQSELGARSAWLDLGEQGLRIRQVLAGVDEEDDMAAFTAWERHLRRELTFPFEATVAEHWGYGPFGIGDRVTVRAIAGVADPYGVLVRVARKGRVHGLPLCDLEVADKTLQHYQLVYDYAVWFANR